MLSLRYSEPLRTRLFAAIQRYKFQQADQPPQVDLELDVYTEEAQYPPIQDLSFRARKMREKLEWHKQIEQVNTIEEKMIKINMPRYWGYKTVRLGDTNFPYNCLPATQHYTHTVFEQIKPLETPIEQQSDQKFDALVLTAKEDIQSSIEYAYDFFRNKYPDESQIEPQEREKLFTQLVVEQVHRALTIALGGDYPHLHEVEVDYNPRHEAFWCVGGINPPKNIVKSIEGRKWETDMAKDPVDRLMQYIASPYLAFRHWYQLPVWKNEAECINADLAEKIPQHKYDPRTLGYRTEHRHGTNIPGYWPGSISNFGCVSYQNRAYMLKRPVSYGAEDFKEVLHAQGIQASYAWLLAQATYNGFSTFNDLTYPMNTQTIITNGRDWSFYEYQLNTLLMHTNHVNDNKRINFCRGTEELQLYQEFDSNGKCVGFNDQVVRYLVQFYVNVPTIQRPLKELRPYLNTKFQCIADYPDEEKRIFLEREFKHLMANRPRHLEKPEIYLWEKIYKIDNKTRPMEAKRRFFELGINPWKRTLDQRQNEYIPRALRPEGPKSRKKWKQMYYP